MTLQRWSKLSNRKSKTVKVRVKSQKISPLWWWWDIWDYHRTLISRYAMPQLKTDYSKSWHWKCQFNIGKWSVIVHCHERICRTNNHHGYHEDQPRQGTGRDPELSIIEEKSDDHSHIMLVPHRSTSIMSQYQGDTDYFEYQGALPKIRVAEQSQEFLCPSKFCCSMLKWSLISVLTWNSLISIMFSWDSGMHSIKDW